MNVKILGLKINDKHCEALIRYIKTRKLHFNVVQEFPRYVDVSITVNEVDAKAIKQLKGYVERHGLGIEFYDGMIKLLNR